MNLWTPQSFDAPTEPSTLSASSAALGVACDDTVLAAAAPDSLHVLRSKAHQEGFVRGLQEGLQEGQSQGLSLGRQEGYETGHAQGLLQGREEGLKLAQEQVQALSESLSSALSSLQEIPVALQQGMTQWVYETAVVLAGRESMDRSYFANAVQESLMRLPKPGENLFLRVPTQDQATWRSLVQGGLPFSCTLLEDAELMPGHAYIEVGGARVNLGQVARDALVRSALGLLPEITN